MMNKATLNIIFCFALAVTTLLCLLGCGKRVTAIEHVEFEKDSIHIENIIKLKQNATFNDIGSLKPFDALKPMLIDGKWYYNTIIEFDKSIDSNFQIKADENLSYAGSESESKNKQVEKTDYSNTIIGVVFVLALFLFLYVYLKNWKP